MSTVAFIEGMVEAGFSMEDALKAARVFEQVLPEAAEPKRSKAAERTRRWREKRHQPSHNVTERHETSQSVTTVTGDATPPLPPSPQTPQPPTPPRVDNPLPPKPTSRRKPETAIPDDCPATDLVAAMQTEAREAGANIDLSFEARQFRDWWTAKDGRNRDWAAAWRTWARRAIGRAPKTASASLSGRQTPSNADARWRSRVREFKANRYWPTDDAGPRPGADGCKVPAHILAEFGLTPSAANDAPKSDLFAGGARA